MNQLQPLLISEFLSRERESLVKTEEELRELPLTYEEKINLLESLLRKTLSFGIEKGIFIEQTKNKTITKAKEKSLDRCVDEIIFNLNDDIMKNRNQPKVKYSKRKYRERKKPQQLNFWSALGFITDFT